jgi:hypothetical protein
MLFPPAALERAMTILEVVLRAISGAISWMQAAEIIGCTDRTVRRWRWRFERDGYEGLLDRRRGRPSPRRALVAEVRHGAVDMAQLGTFVIAGDQTRQDAFDIADRCTAEWDAFLRDHGLQPK